MGELNIEFYKKKVIFHSISFISLEQMCYICNISGMTIEKKMRMKTDVLRWSEIAALKMFRKFYRELFFWQIHNSTFNSYIYRNCFDLLVAINHYGESYLREICGD